MVATEWRHGFRVRSRTVHPPARLDRGLLLLSRLTAGLAGTLAVTALLGWIFDITALRQIIPNMPVTKINTGVALLLLAIARLAARPVVLVCAVLAELIAVLTLFEYATGLRVGIDQLLGSGPAGSEYPGRMSVITAVGVGLLAGATLLQLLGMFGRAQAVALIALVLGSLALLGYTYDVPTLYAIRPISTIAVPTMAAFLLLSVAVLASVPGGALSWAVRSPDGGAVLIRRLLPVALVGLPAAGFLTLLGERAGWFGVATTVAVTVVVCALLVGLFSWTAAGRVTRADRRRERAIAELTSLRIDLERQVNERAQQLQTRRNEIAVLEDRQRIAADLHDIVIQRLFAAGMFLQGSTTLSADPESRERVDAVVEAMDTAIKDLRASIFELGGRAMLREDLTTALDEICNESARVLGFAPGLSVDDPERDGEHAREDILAVVREALANVARHAHADAARVELRSRDGVVAVTIIDNGRGMTESAVRSGTRNMVERARGRGGECVWTAVEPHGTRVHWWVPVAVPVES